MKRETIYLYFSNTNYKKDNRWMHYNQWYHPEDMHLLNKFYKKRENDHKIITTNEEYFSVNEEVKMIISIRLPAYHHNK